jgi:hypothetical protein
LWFEWPVGRNSQYDAQKIEVVVFHSVCQPSNWHFPEINFSRKLTDFLRQKTIESARSEMNLWSAFVGPDSPDSFWQISSHWTSPSIRRGEMSRI